MSDHTCNRKGPPAKVIDESGVALFGAPFCKGRPLFVSSASTLGASTIRRTRSVTFGEMLWLLFGALIGATAAYAIPYAIGLIARLMRPRNSSASAPSTPAPERAADVPKPRISDRNAQIQ